ncbi:hypothetical protein EPO33_02240 [Patescibacteria group bacterium]|nr:MAG: hypothetical protein EPO33_02240 [Patescibacteria group bacterium]
MKNMMMGLMGVLVAAAFVFIGQGIVMHQRVATEEASFHALQAGYFTLSKAEREAAATGSELNAQLVRIQNYPSELLRLKLVGIGKILTGIFILLLGVLMALVMMPVRLAKIIKR